MPVAQPDNYLTAAAMRGFDQGTDATKAWWVLQANAAQRAFEQRKFQEAVAADARDAERRAVRAQIEDSQWERDYSLDQSKFKQSVEQAARDEERAKLAARRAAYMEPVERAKATAEAARAGLEFSAFSRATPEQQTQSVLGGQSAPRPRRPVEIAEDDVRLAQKQLDDARAAAEALSQRDVLSGKPIPEMLPGGGVGQKPYSPEFGDAMRAANEATRAAEQRYYQSIQRLQAAYQSEQQGGGAPVFAPPSNTPATQGQPPMSSATTMPAASTQPAAPSLPPEVFKAAGEAFLDTLDPALSERQRSGAIPSDSAEGRALEAAFIQWMEENRGILQSLSGGGR